MGFRDGIREGSLTTIIQAPSTGSAGTPFNKVLTYVGGFVTHVDLYEDAALTTLLFTFDMTYDGGGLLETFVETRISDAAETTKTFTYDGSGQLTQVIVT